RLEETSRLPLGLNATPSRTSVWPCSARTSAPVSASSTFTTSPADVARDLPSGDQATHCRTPGIVRIAARVETSQTRTVSSPLAEARNLPSGLKATWKTGPLWPTSEPALPVAISQRRTVPSSLAEARRLPSEDHATAQSAPAGSSNDCS